MSSEAGSAVLVHGLWGNPDDYFLTEEDVAWMRAHPDLDVRMLDCDHFVPFRHPPVVADAVVELLHHAARTPGRR